MRRAARIIGLEKNLAAVQAELADLVLVLAAVGAVLAYAEDRVVDAAGEMMRRVGGGGTPTTPE
jgi:hypothetical protein